MYLDPGTGSLVLQLIAAGLISAAATMTRVREALRMMFRRIFTSRSNP